METDIVFTLKELIGRLSNSRSDKEKLKKKMNLKNIGQVRKHLEANLSGTLEYLLRRNIFFRIYKWRCSYCGHSNVITFDLMKETNYCEICSKEHCAGLDLDWKYKLNGFVYSSLIKRNGLSVLWTLAYMHSFTRKSFYYLPEVNLVYENNTTKEKHEEIDILCVQDGTFYAIEVKLSAIQFVNQNGGLEKFIHKINLINPDVALLAFERYCETKADLGSTKKRLQEAITKISKQVKEHINVKVIVASDSNDFNEPPCDIGVFGKNLVVL